MSDNKPFLIKVSRYHPIFLNHTNKFFTIDDENNKQLFDKWAVPNDTIICDG
ncbi:MAG: hypothetical protein BAJALOKI1v1_1730004 [Promethearchaeota archaeon]|nr:MAG: hypothetical protein BAJALOKI1v1_1730004 [Candidatus Lokiarchaeota archaeon]